MHENEYHGTGYIEPAEQPVCLQCERTPNLELSAVSWHEEPVEAYCEEHGVLQDDDFEVIQS